MEEPERQAASLPPPPLPFPVYTKIRWAALLFAMSFPSLMTWLYFVVLPNPSVSGGLARYATVAGYAVSKLIQFTFPVFWVVVVERRQVGIRMPGTRGALTGLGFGVAVAVAVFVLYFGSLRGTAALAAAPAAVAFKVAL